MTPRLDATRYAAAPDFPAYLESVQALADLWHGMSRTASVPPDSIERLKAQGGHWRLLVLSADWCGDCVSCLPIIARLADGAGLEMRLLERDTNLDLMDNYLTCGTRSIPVVMVLDQELSVWAWWGPRPAPLQRWMRAEAAWLPKEDRSRRKRAWYARDRGKTVVAEVIDTVERAARRRFSRGRDAGC